jgi:hypothetical protein
MYTGGGGRGRGGGNKGQPVWSFQLNDYAEDME